MQETFSFLNFIFEPSVASNVIPPPQLVIRKGSVNKITVFKLKENFVFFHEN